LGHQFSGLLPLLLVPSFYKIDCTQLSVTMLSLVLERTSMVKNDLQQEAV
jgi:hypothetical protein